MNTKEQIRQGSVARYGWAGATESSIDDGDLHRFAVLAQRLLQAEFGAVHIMDMDMQVRVAASSGAPLGVMNRSMTICEQILQTTPRPDVFWTADASQDEALVENPWVNGELGSIRYYAAAPLVGREGLPLGTLCVWSEQPAAEQTSIQLLRQLADAVMATLDARRDAAERAYAAEQVRNGALTPGSAAAFYSSPRPATRTLASADRGWNIDAVIDDRAVRTLFQPIVHLGTGSVVGYEALSRGPAGSALESPAALLGAAREVGRLGELDWLCRVHAMQAAAASRLHPSLSWFINVEPAGLDIACPEHLLAGLSQARSDLRVVLEVVERDVEGYVTHLLHAADQARQDAWGIALDDVGAEQGSLALLPFLQPDVVKLDMSLVHELPDNTAAATTAAVRAYAERRGAAILAEGIETEQQERLARVLGATYGQGFRYGRPGLLPESVPAPINVIPLRQRPEPLSGATPFEIGSAASTP
ncbi:MAG: hypothetical protein QOD87_2357, partial [Pseudonocardiales bacterium]|nr:hypothetical protein [Pseudonocardiales bacterium]